MKIINRILDHALMLWWQIGSLIGAPTNVLRFPLPKIMAELSPASAGLKYREVHIPGPLGLYPAWDVPAAGSDKWVVFLHGRGGARVGSLDMLPMMRDLGYNSLVITHRNDWEAPKSPDGLDHLGDTEWRDLEAAIEWIMDQGGSGEIVLFARSAGAQVVGQFLTQSSYGPFIDRVILDNPVLDWQAVFMQQKPSWLPRAVAHLIIWINMRKIGARISQFSWVKHPPIDKPPTLILHTTHDEVCPIDVSRKVNRHLGHVVLVEFPEGGHEGARFTDPGRYLHLVRNWLAPGQMEQLVESLEQMSRGEGVVRVEDPNTVTA